MRIIWSAQAAEDFEEIIGFVAESSSQAATRLASHIFDRITGLTSFPYIGRKRKEDSARELIFTPFTYICVYELIGEAIHIKAIRHTSRDNVATS